MEHPWYVVIGGNDTSLEQGDLFSQLPVTELLDNVSAESEGHRLRARANLYDVVVLSQSCDLQNDKLDTVLLCPFFNVDDLSESYASYRGKQGAKTLEDIRRGWQPGSHMLRACDLPGFERPHAIVFFNQVFALPLTYVKRQAEQQRPRIRLLPPYREHLAQAFARFIMRVGLPEDIEPFR